MAKASKNPATSRPEPKSTEERAAALIAGIGGADEVTVSVFRRVPGSSERTHVATYNEEDFTPERVLTDHGAGYYMAQVKHDTRILRSKNFAVGDVSDLTPTVREKTEKRGDGDELSGGGLVRLLLAQQQQTTSIMVAMIQAQAGRAQQSDPVLALLVKGMMEQKSGGTLGDAMKAIETARDLVGDGGGGGGGDAGSMIGAIGQIAAAIPAAIRELRGVAASRPVANTAAKPAQPNTTPAKPDGVGASEKPGGEVATSQTGEASPPAAEAHTPPPSAKRVPLPFPGAAAIAERLRVDLREVPEDFTIPAGLLPPDKVALAASFCIDEIELAGGDLDYVLELYPDNGDLADALVQYAPDIMRALAVVQDIEDAIRVADKAGRDAIGTDAAKPDDAGDRDQT